jgi:cytochrome c oxidase subunit 2
MVALLAGSAIGGAAARLLADQPTEITITAMKFVFKPNKVTVKQGRPVVLVLTSEDRIHGFKMPDFGIRAEILPYQDTRVTLTPDKVGTFTFLCDVFCGDGHEEMEGEMIVEA